MGQICSDARPWARLLPGALLLCLALAGCEPATNDTVVAPAAPDDATTADLRAELERLENALGRLEFRVYELEAAAGMTEPAEPPPAQDLAAPAPPAGAIDLTPVE